MLQKNISVEIIISEPWDAVTPQGENKFTGDIIDRTVSKYGEAFLIKVHMPFMMKGLDIKYLVALYRNEKLDLKAINIYYIHEDLIEEFDGIDNLEDKMVYIMIGTVKRK